MTERAPSNQRYFVCCHSGWDLRNLPSLCVAAYNRGRHSLRSRGCSPPGRSNYYVSSCFHPRYRTGRRCGNQDIDVFVVAYTRIRPVDVWNPEEFSLLVRRFSQRKSAECCEHPYPRFPCCGMILKNQGVGSLNLRISPRPPLSHLVISFNCGTLNLSVSANILGRHSTERQEARLAIRACKAKAWGRQG